MDEAHDNYDIVTKLVSPGRQTDPAVKEDAFRLWVSYGRSWRIVAKQLDISERTLQRWAESDQWEQRRHDQAASFLPGMTTEGAISARMAGHNAMVRLQQISYECLEYGIKPDLKEVQALTMIADRGGFAHVGNKAMPEITLPTNEAISSESLEGKSSDELMRLELEYRATRKPR